MVSESTGNHFYDGSVTEPVHLRHWIEFSFILHWMGMAKMEHLDPARFFGCSNGDAEIAIILFHIIPSRQLQRVERHGFGAATFIVDEMVSNPPSR
jgi:hypothetical protein